MKKNFKLLHSSMTYTQTIQFLWDWYNHLKTDDLPQDVLRYMRQFAFFNPRIVNPSKFEVSPQKPYRLSDLPPNSGVEKSGFFSYPSHHDFLNVLLQRYMKRLTSKLYQSNKDILGDQPEILFHWNTDKRSEYTTGILSSHYPAQIIFSLEEIGTLYQTEDQLVASLAHELIHFTISKVSINHLLTKTEEALADLLGTLIIARAGYRPSQNVLFFAYDNERAIPLFLSLQKKQIPARLTPEEIVCLTEVASFGYIQIPREKMYLFERNNLPNDHVHPHDVTRMIYLNQLNEYFYKIGLLHENDPFANGRPIDPIFLNFIKKHQNSTVRRPLKHTRKRYMPHRFYFKEKE